MSIFIILFLVACILFFVGLIKPKFVVRWGPETKRNKKWAAIYTIVAAVVSFVLIGVTMTPEQRAESHRIQQLKREQRQEEERIATEKKILEEKTAKELEEKKAKEEKATKEAEEKKAEEEKKAKEAEKKMAEEEKIAEEAEEKKAEEEKITKEVEEKKTTEVKSGGMTYDPTTGHWKRTPAENTPTTRQETLSVDDQIRKLVAQAVKTERIGVVNDSDNPNEKYVVVVFSTDEGRWLGSTSKYFNVTCKDVLKQLYTSGLPISKVNIVGRATVKNQYGNNVGKSIASCELSKNGANRINWDPANGITSGQIPGAVDSYWAAPELYRD